MSSKSVIGAVLFATALSFQGATGAPAPGSPTGQCVRTTGREVVAHAVFRWSVGQERVRMIRAEDGICFLSAVGGSFAGGGEWVRVRIDDGFWYLEGHCQQPFVFAEATCVQFDHLASAARRE
ncbi:MAG TPA: hypothetical protein VFD82_07295 [Planctomycetota bacterium]|nr:hypothetical protein [Planctomycetota bacterium]